MTMGGSLAFTPGYTTQQSASQALDQSRSRSMDFFAQWVISPKLSARVSVNNIVPLDSESLTQTSDGYANNSLRGGRSSFNIGVESSCRGQAAFERAALLQIIHVVADSLALALQKPRHSIRKCRVCQPMSAGGFDG